MMLLDKITRICAVIGLYMMIAVGIFFGLALFSLVFSSTSPWGIRILLGLFGLVAITGFILLGAHLTRDLRQ